MVPFALDFETHKFRPGIAAPRAVCAGVAFAREDEARIVDRLLAGAPFLPEAETLDRAGALWELARALVDEDVVFVNVEAAFDLLVAAAEAGELLVPIFEAYRDDRVRCVAVRQMLIDIARGEREWRSTRRKRVKAEYGLDDLALHWLGEEVVKKDTWRLRYGELDGVPLDEWDDDAIDYPRKDARVALREYAAQEAHLRSEKEHRYIDAAGAARRGLPDEGLQNRAAWALRLMSSWGVRTDPVAVANLRALFERDLADDVAALQGTGLVDARGKQSEKAIEARVAQHFAARGEKPPRTRTGDVSTTKEVFIQTADPALLRLSMLRKNKKNLSTYVTALELGVRVPICGSYITVVANGRTSMREPNLQNPPRKGGIRECCVARPGTLFCSTDLDTIEMRSFAQACIDLGLRSTMAEAIRRGDDLHLRVAAEILSITYAEAVARYEAGDADVEDARQIAKPANFGFPGGMGEDTFVAFAALQGISLGATPREALAMAKRLKASWFAAFPEAAEYFAIVTSLTKGSEGRVRQLRSLRLRGGLSFTELANGYWSALAADASKSGLWEVSYACYVGTCNLCRGAGGRCAPCRGTGRSPLLGSRPVLYVHDEIISEVPDDPRVSTAAAEEQARLFVGEVQRWLPDVPVTGKPVLMRRWWKGAKPIRDAQNNILPVRPRREGKKTTWVHDEDGAMPLAA